MIESAYHFCPQCGKPLHTEVHESEEVHVCEQGHVLYKNQNVTVDGVIIRDGQVLLARRGRDPQIGFLDLPGGFVIANEKPQDAIVREIREELQVEAKVVRLLGVYGPTIYPYKGVTQFNTGVMYLLTIGTEQPIPTDDVASLEWYGLSSLPYGKLAFTSQNDFFEDIRSGKIDLS